MEALFLILKDEEVNKFLPWYPLKNLEETKKFYEERYASKYEQPQAYAYAICLKEDNFPIGYIKVDMEEHHDFGYGLRKEFWHKGIVAEAGKAVVEQVKRDGLPYITATHDKNNPRSGNVMKNTFIEHSFIINNFVVMIGRQIKDSLCRVLGDGVQYQWYENDDKIIIPDVSINCNTRDRKNVSLTGIPRMIMEVLSNATEEYDRGEKMEIYQKVGVSEYWIVDWRKKQVEIYLNDGKEDGTTCFYLYKTVMKENKEDLQLVMFPDLKTDFDELFNL